MEATEKIRSINEFTNNTSDLLEKFNALNQLFSKVINNIIGNDIGEKNDEEIEPPYMLYDKIKSNTTKLDTLLVNYEHSISELIDILGINL